MNTTSLTRETNLIKTISFFFFFFFQFSIFSVWHIQRIETWRKTPAKNNWNGERKWWNFVFVRRLIHVRVWNGIVYQSQDTIASRCSIDMKNRRHFQCTNDTKVRARQETTDKIDKKQIKIKVLLFFPVLFYSFSDKKKKTASQRQSGKRATTFASAAAAEGDINFLQFIIARLPFSPEPKWKNKGFAN